MKRKIIALTGTIGSGKSAVAQILSKTYGFDVVDCDKLSKKAAELPRLLDAVQMLLGPQSVKNGKLNRKFVRETVFTDDALYARYSAIFWEEISRLLAEAVQTLGQIVFVEIPVLDAFPFDWSEVWLVEACSEIQISRVAARDGVSAKNVTDILSKQKPCTNFTRKILNDGTLPQLVFAVENALKSSGLLHR